MSNNVQTKKNGRIDTIECKEQLDFEIGLWNRTGREHLIGSVRDAEEGYVKSTPWSIHGPYYPKKFDFKIKVYNRLKAYNEPDTINNWNLNVYMRFKVGQNKKGKYPLNHKVKENVHIVNDLKVNASDFKGSAIKHDIIVRDIEFEEYYSKYDAGINQIVFIVVFTDEQSNSYC